MSLKDQKTFRTIYTKIPPLKNRILIGHDCPNVRTGKGMLIVGTSTLATYLEVVNHTLFKLSITKLNQIRISKYTDNIVKRFLI